MSASDNYLSVAPPLTAQWRAIVLFGRNSASYKFSLAKALLDFAEAGRGRVSLEELALPYAQHIAEHLRREDRQGTSASARFLDSCRAYNAGSLGAEGLRAAAVRDGFNHVLDAFHRVNGAPVPDPFFRDERAAAGGIVLTDALHRVVEGLAGRDLRPEVDARWRLVETAWGLGVAHPLLDVEHDADAGRLFVRPGGRRVDVTSARDGLNGYQKGACFYCYAAISVTPGSESLADVDHVWPHLLGARLPGVNLDGVWNLVLACPRCNRGPGGKFARLPASRYLERLHRRNEFLIGSHHPLRETLLRQTGQSAGDRRAFLKDVDRRAHEHLIHRWTATEVAACAF